MDLIEASAVVLAQGHNPTILHPAFLVAQGIIPAQWELAGPPISMPPLAMATYSNGISFSADESRFVVRDARPIGGRDRFRAFELARLYVEALPHVPYTAVGVNFQGFLPTANPLETAFERIFRRDGPIQRFGAPEMFNLSIQHNLGEVVRSVTLAPAGRDFGRTGLILTANYHVVVNAENRLESTRQALDASEHRWQDFEEINDIEQDLQERP